MSDRKYRYMMRHGANMNGMNKECMLEKLHMVRWNDEADQVASEKDTCACMNHQENTNTIK